MMMNLINNRITAFNITSINDTLPNDPSTDHQRPVFPTSHGGISVTREEWTDEDLSSRGQGAKGVTVARKQTLNSV